MAYVLTTRTTRKVISKVYQLIALMKLGYQAGLNGEEYLRVCPIEIEDDFLIGYDLGFQTLRISDAIERTGVTSRAHHQCAGS